MIGTTIMFLQRFQTVLPFDQPSQRDYMRPLSSICHMFDDSDSTPRMLDTRFCPICPVFWSN